MLENTTTTFTTPETRSPHKGSHATAEPAKVRTARRRHLNGEQGAARELHLGARRDECRPGPGESAAASEESDGEHFGGFVGEGTAPRELATGRFV